jgi:hypothetical protein
MIRRPIYMMFRILWWMDLLFPIQAYMMYMYQNIVYLTKSMRKMFKQLVDMAVQEIGLPISWIASGYTTRATSCYLFEVCYDRVSKKYEKVQLNKRKSKIYSAMIRGDKIGYYFGRPRPPEQHAISQRYKPWRLCSLKTIGWGPPAFTRPINQEVQRSS